VPSKVYGFYEAQGTLNSTTQLPGGRYSHSLLVMDDLMISFGGFGFANSTVSGYLNDVWTYDLNVNYVWEWRSGNSSVNVINNINYGIKGQFAETNLIGSRSDQVSASLGESMADIVAVFGGIGYADDGFLGYLSGMA